MTYTNRKGQTFYLCSTPTRGGKNRYYLAKRPTGTPVSAVPDGFEIREDVNGLVSIGRCLEINLTAEEISTVQAVLNRQPDPESLRLAIKPLSIEVHEASPFDFGGLELFPWQRQTLRMRHAHYHPRLRFVLVDVGSRQFWAERMCYRSAFEGWRPLGRPAGIARLSASLIPKIANDELLQLA